MITSNTNTAKNSISTTDMKEFEEKLDKFKAYWLAESEKYAKANLMKIMTEDLDKLKEQVLDLSDGGKRDIQSIENKLEVFAEDIENSVESGRIEDRKYVDEKIDSIEKHGISGAALENIATLQHRYDFRSIKNLANDLKIYFTKLI